MSIYLNNQGLKKVKAVAANINNSLKTIKGVYINVNGTIHKVWPYYAFDNGTFKGELQGGIINAPRNLRLAGSTGDSYRWPNGSNWGSTTDMGQTVTSGTLSASKSSPFGDNNGYGPFFVSAGTINFTKYSKVRIAGSFTATMRAYNGNNADAFMDATIQPREYVKSGNYYNCVASVNKQSTTDITTSGTSWYTGTVNYNFTFDISSWNETSGIFCLFVNNNWYDVNHVTGGEYGSQTITINEIEFS